MSSSFTLIQGDCLHHLQQLPDNSFQSCITSPPYWNLRDYNVDGQIGLEPSLEDYLSRITAVFREVRRTIKPTGTLWLNAGDLFIKKQLVGLPWRIAFALQSDGWILRSDIIWHKPNAMPESVKDRPTRAHEYIFLLSKSPHYLYNFKAIQEPVSGTAHPRGHGLHPKANSPNSRMARTRSPIDNKPNPSTWNVRANHSFSAAVKNLVRLRNKRSVWSIATKPFKGAHYASFPPNLVSPCILASSNPNDLILDPFAGSGTTGAVAIQLSRTPTLIELNPDYCHIIHSRLSSLTPGLPL